MDEFFELFDSSQIMSWLEETPQLSQSAFERYTRLPFQRHACNNPNANKRMIEFLRKNRAAPPLGIETTQQERERSLKHMMMERMRRKKHHQIYLALHELLPQGTKSDKNSILETAVKEIEELRRRVDELRKRNGEMEMIFAAFENEKTIEKAQLDLKVEHSACGVDSMLEMRASEVEKAVQRSLFDAEMKFRHHH